MLAGLARERKNVIGRGDGGGEIISRIYIKKGFLGLFAGVRACYNGGGLREDELKWYFPGSLSAPRGS